MNLYEHIARNKRSTWYVVSVIVIFFLMIGEAMDAVAKKFKEARAVVVGLCVLTLVGNTLSTVDFLRVAGRF